MLLLPSEEERDCAGINQTRRVCATAHSLRVHFSEEQAVEPAQHAGDLADAAHRQERSGHVRLRGRACLVADHEPVAGGGEDHVGREREARQAHRVHARAGDRGAARLGRADQVGELARGAAGYVGLAGRAVVDHLPVVHVLRRERGGVQQRRGQHGEVARRDHAAAGRARGRVDLLVVRRGQPGRADDGVQPGGQRRVDVPAHDAGLGEVDEHVGLGRSERLLDGLEVGPAAGDPAGELEVVGGAHRLGERGAGPAGRTRDEDSQHRRRIRFAAVAKGEFTMIEAAGREVRLSNPGKVYFPRPGWTKLDLVEYYLTTAEAVTIHLRERPTVLKRFVNGIMEEPIWQKRVPKNIPEWLETATVAFPSGRTAEELVANDAAHLVWAVNLGVIDFNPWPARRADLDAPDELRVDLDPGPGVPWDHVRRTALVVRDVLEEHGLRGYPKTSGSKGIHVNVRIEPRWDHTEVRRAALALAREVERRVPDLATSRWWKEERHGVFVDYNQNARDRTVASCWSVRPTRDARVSCALRWDEVPDVEPGDLRLDTVPDRLRTVGDPAGDIDEQPGTLDQLLDLARRDEEEGLGDAPWPPHFPKQKGEPKRVQPSRDRDRPTHRGRVGDPQPGGPPPGLGLGGLQRGFGSKPRTGQGYDEDWSQDS